MEDKIVEKNNSIVQDLSLTKNSSRKNIIIFLFKLLLLCLLLGVLLIVFLPQPQKQSVIQPAAIPLQGNRKNYINDYWGFSAKYPKEWTMYEAPSGMNYFFDSYKGNADKDLWYLPREDELQIKINIAFDSQSFTWTSEHGVLSEKDGPIVIGEKSREIYRRQLLSNFEKANNKNNSTPPSLITKGDYTLTYKIKHSGLTFHITAKPADSTLLPQFHEFINEFSFIKRREYEKDGGNAPKNKQYHQDINLGFIFEYPDGMICKNDLYACVLTKENDSSPLAPYIMVEIADNIYNDYERFEENIINYASTICVADGPGGSQYCPTEDMTAYTFKNKYNVAGYKVQRKIIQANYVGDSKEIVDSKNDTVIFYKLEAPHNFTVLFRVDTHGEDRYDWNNELLDVANSFRYLKIKE